MQHHYKILYVDDEPYNLKAFFHTFRSFYDIVLAERAAEALHFLSQLNDVAVLITDQRMPDMDGVTLMRTVSQQYPKVVKMMLTAYGDKHELIDAINEGKIYAFINKPWDELDLRLKIDKAIEHYQLICQNERLVRDLQAINTSLEERIEARTQELLRKNQELERLTNLQNRLFSIIAHDLRSPLHTLSNFLQVFIQYAEEGFTMEELISTAQNIHTYLRNIQQLLDNLIQWARVQLKELHYAIYPIDVEEIIQNNINLVRYTAAEKHISIELANIQARMVLGNREMLDFVLRNILFNAVKFTPEGGKIRLMSLPTHVHMAEIVVEDTGIGIPDWLIRRILEGSDQVSTLGTKGEQGTGLGLMLCKEFTQRMQGDLLIYSQEGSGTRVVIRLPVPSSGIEAEM